MLTAPAKENGADLFVSCRRPAGSWSTAVNLGRDVNSGGHDLCPIVSPDGKYLFFLSNREGESAVYWVDIGVVERLRPRR
jgi:dipeptidyl aminopeptidase/acylaminoacyl peptidase